jgi:hypothetical protein
LIIDERRRIRLELGDGRQDTLGQNLQPDYTVRVFDPAMHRLNTEAR